MGKIEYDIGTLCMYGKHEARVKMAMNMMDGAPRRFIEFRLESSPMMLWVNPDELSPYVEKEVQSFVVEEEKLSHAPQQMTYEQLADSHYSRGKRVDELEAKLERYGTRIAELGEETSALRNVIRVIYMEWQKIRDEGQFEQPDRERYEDFLETLGDMLTEYM